MQFKNAFKCKNCPESSNRDGCPCWWEIPWENAETGEIQMRKGCILSQDIGLPIVQAVVRAAHIASEHASVVRNSFDNGFAQLNKLATIAIKQRNEVLLEQRKDNEFDGTTT